MNNGDKVLVRDYCPNSKTRGRILSARYVCRLSIHHKNHVVRVDGQSYDRFVGRHPGCDLMFVAQHADPKPEPKRLMIARRFNMGYSYFPRKEDKSPQ